MPIKILRQLEDGSYQWVNVSDSGTGGGGGGSLDELEVDYTDTNNTSNYTGDKSLVVTTPQTGTKRLNIQYDGSVGANAYGRKYVQSSEPTSPNNGDIWYDTSGDVATSGITRHATVYDSKDGGTDAGSPPNTGYHDRTLNKKDDPYGLIDLDPGNVYFLLVAGSYRINWRVPANEATGFRAKLVYANNSSFNSPLEVLGESSIVNNAGWEPNGYNCGSAIITISETHYFKIQQALNVAGNWGKACNVGGEEIYTQVFVEDLATAVKNTSNNYVSGTSKRAKVEDIGTSYTDEGGSFNSEDGWITRSLNTVTDPKGIGVGINVTDKYITVPAGTYSFRWSAPAFNVDRHVTRLTYSDNPLFSGNNTFDLYAPVAFCEFDGEESIKTSWTQTRSTGFAPSLTFNAKTYIRVQHYSDTGNSSGDAMGVSSPFNNCKPIFAFIEIEDLATAVKDSSPAPADVPVGGIIMWSGTKTALDALTNWVLCDDSAAAVSAGAPDLRDKFIIGAASFSDEGDGQWETNVTGSGTQSGGHKNTVLIGHSHSGMVGGSSTDDGVSTNYPGKNTANIGYTGVDQDCNSNPDQTGENKNLPPYFALAYIMKIS